MSEIIIIAAVGENFELGKNNRLLWQLPADLEHFKKTTEGHPVIMGRKTFESIGKALPRRRNIVVTRNPDFSASNIETADSVEAAVELAQTTNAKIFIIGGEQIFRQALPLADHLIITHVLAEFPDAEAFFPELSDEWDLDEIQHHGKDDENEFDFVIAEYRRPH